MAAGTVSFRQLILGLLTHKPMSGYDIKLFLKSLGWLVGDPSFGAIYPALHGLLKEGLVTVEVLPSQTKPPRKMYSITGAGVQSLQEWSDRPAAGNASLKTFVMRLILADNLSGASLQKHLQQRRGQVADHYAALERMIQHLDGKRDLGQRLALDYSMAIAHAELAWLDDVLARLGQELASEGVAEGSPVTDAA